MLSYYYYCHIFHVSIHLKIEVQSLEYQCSCMYSTYMYEKMAVVYITYCSVQYILSDDHIFPVSMHLKIKVLSSDCQCILIIK